jgi:hypothetical protein
LAIAALNNVEFEPSFLNGASLAAASYAFYSHDFAVTDAADRGDARSHGFSVDMDRTGTALSDTTTEFGPL